jgi:hypothetical protein
MILLNPFDEANRLATEKGDWMCAVIETKVFWPKEMQVVSYEGKNFLLLPSGEPLPPYHVRQSPAITLRGDTYKLTRIQTRREIMRFASSLSWREGGKIEIVAWTGGNIPRSMGIMRNNTVIDYMSSEFLPSLTDETNAAALAFYREGVSLDNPFYAFLSFYKAFSVAVPNGRTRGQWLKDKTAAIDDPDAKERIKELESKGIDVSDYIYKQGRHAIAHADKEPFVNPDNTDDRYRLSLDLCVMRNFAELAIEDKLGIKRRNTISREHLYELEGFRSLIPKEIVDQYKRGEGAKVKSQIDMPELFTLLAQKRHEQFPLGQMKIVQAICFEYGLIIDFESTQGIIRLRVILNFATEKLLFDPLQHLVVGSGRGNQDAIREELSALRFSRCILSNGHLEIWDPIKDIRLGCSEGYIPVNCRIDDDYFDEQTRVLEAILNPSVG